MQNNIGKDICVLVETENFLNRGDSCVGGGERKRKWALLQDKIVEWGPFFCVFSSELCVLINISSLLSNVKNKTNPTRKFSSTASHHPHSFDYAYKLFLFSPLLFCVMGDGHICKISYTALFARWENLKKNPFIRRIVLVHICVSKNSWSMRRRNT